MHIVQGEVDYAPIVKDSFSVSFWFYVEGMGAGKRNVVRLASIGNTAFTIHYNCFGQIEVHVALKQRAGNVAVDNNDLEYATTLPTRRWHFLVVSLENIHSGTYCRGRVYINGRDYADRLFDAPFEIQSDDKESDSVVRLGNNDESTLGFEGKLDDFSVWGKALTKEESDELYHERDGNYMYNIWRYTTYVYICILPLPSLLSPSLLAPTQASSSPSTHLPPSAPATTSSSGIPDYGHDLRLLTAWSFDFVRQMNLNDVRIPSETKKTLSAERMNADRTYTTLSSDSGARMGVLQKAMPPFPSRHVRDSLARKFEVGQTRAQKHLVAVGK